MLHTRQLMLCLALIFISAGANAQYGGFHYHHYKSYSQQSGSGKKSMQRSFIAGWLPFMTTDISQHYTVSNTSTYQNGVWVANPMGANIDTIIKMHLSNSSSWGFGSGGFIPIARFGEQSMIAIEVMMGFTYHKWTVGQINYSSTTSVSDDATSLHVDLPISFQYKYGGDVDLNKKHKFMCAIGAGFAPTLCFTQYLAGDVSFANRPFVVMEAGIFAGIAFKLRATFYSGTITYLNETNADLSQTNNAKGDLSGNLALKMSSPGGINLALILMPYSWHWGEDEY